MSMIDNLVPDNKQFLQFETNVIEDCDLTVQQSGAVMQCEPISS